MSLVVSDTGPINYLVLCDVVEFLPHLYHRIVIPSSVLEELRHPRAPNQVGTWITCLPNWVEVQKAKELDPDAHLGKGEREAIALVCELSATQLMVDDRVARRVATERGILVTGTVGVIEKMTERGLINLAEVIRKLLNTNFRVAPDVVRAVLERDAARRNSSQP